MVFNECIDNSFTDFDDKIINFNNISAIRIGLRVFFFFNENGFKTVGDIK